MVKPCSRSHTLTAREGLLKTHRFSVWKGILQLKPAGKELVAEQLPVTPEGKAPQMLTALLRERNRHKTRVRHEELLPVCPNQKQVRVQPLQEEHQLQLPDPMQIKIQIQAQAPERGLRQAFQDLRQNRAQTQAPGRGLRQAFQDLRQNRAQALHGGHSQQ